jgi:diguanylate cyclase (GGDEF)-like protein
LRGAVRGGDTVGRWGGDEFVAVLRSWHAPDGADAAADRLRWTMQSTPFQLPCGEVEVTASVGVAVLGIHGATASALITAADGAAKAAKEAGRNRTRLALTTVAESVA